MMTVDNSNSVRILRLWLLALLALGTGILFASCTTNGDNAASSGLAGRTWVLESLRVNGTDMPPISGSTITIAFDDGFAGGSGGCNSYSGECRTTDSGTMSFGRLACTEMYCLTPEGVNDQEGLYLSMLGDVSSFETAGNRLVLSCGDGRSLAFLASNL